MGNYIDTPPFPGMKEGILTARTLIDSETPLGFSMVLKNVNDPGEIPTFVTFPSITITSPEDRTTFSANQNIQVTAEAIGQNITGVAFYMDSLRVTTDKTAPYTFSLKNLTPGEHVLIARALTQGSEGASAPVRFTVPRTAGSIDALGKYVDVDHGHPSSGAEIRIMDCGGSATQKFSLTPAGKIRTGFNTCLDVYHSRATNGTKVQEYTCNGTGGQNWNFWPP